MVVSGGVADPCLCDYMGIWKSFGKDGVMEITAINQVALDSLVAALFVPLTNSFLFLAGCVVAHVFWTVLSKAGI